MVNLPATDLRTNVLTLAIPNEGLPRVARDMTQWLPPENYDPTFAGQQLETTYFDTLGFALRKARLKKDRYLTLRIRCYGPSDTYALSAKTEAGKFRKEIPSEAAEFYIRNGIPPLAARAHLPGDLLARLLELTEDQPLYRVATLRFTRYAVENEVDRVTLDINIAASTGKVFPTNILENKSTSARPTPLPEVLALPYPPVKLSKFLWATTYGVR